MGLSAWDDENELYDASLLMDDQLLNSSPTRGGNAQESQRWLPLENTHSGKNPSPSICLSQSTKPVITGAGLENLGNTCFLNSVLQCFIHTVPLLHRILFNGHLVHSNCKEEGFCLLCALQDLIVCSLASTNDIIAPSNLANNLSYISSSFRRHQQEDAHEFLHCFLDRLESCHNLNNKGVVPSESVNIVKQVFGGRLVSKVKCCCCGHCSYAYEPAIDMSLGIENADSLLAALQFFTNVEKIEGPEANFKCEKCKEQVSVEKNLSFDQVPSVAVFHLKRFESDGYNVQKIYKHVAFPLDLDLLPFTVNAKNNDEDLKYVLYAVVVHVALTSTSGHYYCFIRLSPNVWCKFDDSKVVLVHEDFVLSQEAYVLFYAKESTPWFTSFAEAQERIVQSTLWETSPVSVLDNTETSSVSSKIASHDIGSARRTTVSVLDNTGTSSVSSKRASHDIGSAQRTTVSVLDNTETSSVCSKRASHDIGSAHRRAEIKDRGQMQNNKIERNRSSSTTQTALRSQSPEIYRREDPNDNAAAGGFSISRDHLRLVNRMSCKRQLEKDMDDETREACSFIKKTMPGSRGKQLAAAIRAGIKPQASPKQVQDTNKARRLSNDGGSSSSSSQSTTKNSFYISPSRFYG